jgi:hypothetical protein
MNWKLAAAKQQLSKVVRLAQDEPQILHNREQPVAAVISTNELNLFRAWKKEHSDKTLAQAFAALRQTASDESWELEVPGRTDRVNAWIGATEKSAKRSVSKKGRL